MTNPYKNNPATDVTAVGDVTDATTDIVVTERNVIGNSTPRQPRPNGETDVGVGLEPFLLLSRTDPEAYG